MDAIRWWGGLTPGQYRALPASDQGEILGAYLAEHVAAEKESKEQARERFIKGEMPGYVL